MKSFQEILDEKLQSPKMKNLNFNYFSNDTAYDLHANYIFIEPFQTQNTSSSLKKAGLSSYKVKTKVIIPKAHNLNLSQEIALNWFLKQGVLLSNSFSKTEVIKGFRQLAFALHPDYNKNPDAHGLYLTLHENKEILMQIFKSKI
jgi:hypothetical protein